MALLQQNVVLTHSPWYRSVRITARSWVEPQMVLTMYYDDDDDGGKQRWIV